MDLLSIDHFIARLFFEEYATLTGFRIELMDVDGGEKILDDFLGYFGMEGFLIVPEMKLMNFMALIGQWIALNVNLKK